MANFLTNRESGYSPMQMSRKKILLCIGLGIVVLAIVLGVAIGVPLSKRSTSDLDKAIDILENNPLIDG